MWTRRTVTGVVIVAMLGGLLMSGGSPVSTAQQAPPGPPHRIGYVSRDTTGLFRATGEGSAPVLPAALSDVDSSPSAGGTLPGLVWVSKRGGARQGNLFYLRDGGDKPVQLTTDDSVDEHPALSPDGRTVAYVSERSGNRDIWVIGVDGKGQRQLTDSPAADSWPTWSPDGGTLAFSSTRDDPLGDLYTVPFTGGAQVRITNDPAADTQPAWGPGRIAFTTTRFHPAGDVVTMAVTGGLVLRAVPDQGDSSEPAWTPSGGLVFTRHSADPAGDVLQVVNGQVTTVAARSRVGEFGATVRRNGEILFTQLQSGNSDDIWSSDAAGGDRRDLTNRPGADEEDPAFSPDGAFLAYTEFPSEGSASRVMVAASDGRGPRPLTGVTPSGSSHERQPAWSPDGTMIAFTQTVPDGDGTRDFVRIVRVADSRVLGDVPMPAHLTGDDSQPAWSPDGTRIVLTRASARRSPPPPSRVEPPRVDMPIAQGKSALIDKIVHTDAIRSNPDIVLLIDQTGSMGGGNGVLANIKKSLNDVIDAVVKEEKSPRFAVTAFGDRFDPDGRLFQVKQPMIGVDEPGFRDKLTAAVDGINPDFGDLTPEDWIFALHKVATGSIDFRQDSSKIVVLIGDATSHDPSGNPEVEPTATLASATADLKAKNISLVAVPVDTGGDPARDPDIGLDRKHQASDIAAATGGVVTQTTTAVEIGKAITQGIKDLPVTVRPVPRCDPGLTIGFVPGSQQIPGGADARFAETPVVGGTVPVGTVLHCAVDFILNNDETVRPGYTQDVTVRVKDPTLPVITVPDQLVSTERPEGATIDYPASAVDVDGSPVTPTCTPLPGSLFPVGVTTVTCSAVGAAGTAVATATMTVVALTVEFPRELWSVVLDRSVPDVIGFGDQRDLSARIGAPCATGSEGTADFSPDGATIAFQHNNSQICTASADGTGGRILVERAGFVDDPAWSPDGALIAFTLIPGETSPRVAVVPSGGGAFAVLLDSPGGAAQPAFQRVANLAVTATAVPAAIPFNGRSTLEFLVTNHGAATAPAAALTAALPAGLRFETALPSKGTCAALRCDFGALAPGDSARVQIVVTGVQAGPQVATGILSGGPDADPRDDRVSITVTVAEPVKPPPNPGSLSLAMAVSVVPGFVGGDDIVVTYLLHNGAPVPMTDVRLATSLPSVLLPAKAVSPSGCSSAGGCALGSLAAGQNVEVRFTLPAKSTVDAPVSGTVSTSGPDSDPADNTANARIVVRQPVLKVDPPVGPLGFVPRVTGTDFPPGAVVKLTWSAGISATPGQFTVGADGRFAAQFLIFHHDLIGPRTARATSVSGPAFGAVQSNPILVVLRTEQPPFITRD